MRTERINKRPYLRGKVIPTKALEEYPFEFLMEKFLQAIAPLEVDCDQVEGLMREYISTSKLVLPYRLCFGAAAIADSTLVYRLRHINPLEFPNDFLILEECGRGDWQPKYFVNRLNKNLLKRIFLPPVTTDWRQLVHLTLLLEDDVITLHELDEEEEED
jgi:hypothetical protein